ncbi:MAG: hypothetical protein HDR88_13595 [Bacteroides sp.]|nr:hypothetical protein [Bacteroides sp.]
MELLCAAGIITTEEAESLLQDFRKLIKMLVSFCKTLVLRNPNP